MESHILEKVILVVALGIGAQWLAWRFKLPAIVLLALSGVVAGPVLGFLNPFEDFGNLTGVLIKLAVAVILFEGGMNLRLYELREAGRAVRGLVFLGLPVSWITISAGAYLIGGISLPVSLVLGGILVVTGPTVIIPLIRQTKLSPRISSLLKWEGIVNDPLGALLAVVVFEFIIATSSHGHSSVEAIAIRLLIALVASFAMAYLVAMLARISFHRGWVPEFLKVPVVLSAILVVYGLADLIQEEAGLLAVTILGMLFGSLKMRIEEDLRVFKENVTVFLVSGVFVVLSATLKVEYLDYVTWRTMGFLAFILFIARPITVFFATMGSGLPLNEKILLGWIAPRGVVAASVAGLFAPLMVKAGYEDGILLVPYVFGVVFSTVVLHGFSLSWVAKKLGLSHSGQEGILLVGASPWSTDLAASLKEIDVPVMLADSSWYRLRNARLRGIEVHFGNVISEKAEEVVAFHEMGALIATSDNDAYNALVCSAFSPHFGREKVFQLSFGDKSKEETQEVRAAHRGRIAFGKHLTYEKLVSLHYRGWSFVKTKITKEFSFEHFKQEYGEDAELILVKRKNGSLVIDLSNKEIKPQAGDTVLAYVHKPKA